MGLLNNYRNFSTCNTMLSTYCEHYLYTHSKWLTGLTYWPRNVKPMLRFTKVNSYSLSGRQDRTLCRMLISFSIISKWDRLSALSGFMYIVMTISLSVMTLSGHLCKHSYPAAVTCFFVYDFMPIWTGIHIRNSQNIKGGVTYLTVEEVSIGHAPKTVIHALQVWLCIWAEHWYLGTISTHMMTSPNGNIFRVTCHLCGEFTGDRLIPHTKTSDAELWCFLWSAPE